MDDGIDAHLGGDPGTDARAGRAHHDRADPRARRESRRHIARRDPVDAAAPAVRVELRRQLGSALRPVRQGADHDLRARRRTTRPNGEFGDTARPLFGFDFRTLALYDVPGVVTPPDPSAREPFGRPVRVPVRPHLGVIGVAPPERSGQQHPAGRVRRQRRQLALRAGGDDPLPRLPRGRRVLCRRPALRPGRRRDLRHRDRGLARRHAATVDRRRRATPTRRCCSPTATGSRTASATTSTRRWRWPPTRRCACSSTAAASRWTRPTRWRPWRSTSASHRSSTASSAATLRSPAALLDPQG